MHVYLADDFVHGGAVGGRGAGDRIGKRTPESECGEGGFPLDMKNRERRSKPKKPTTKAEPNRNREVRSGFSSWFSGIEVLSSISVFMPVNRRTEHSAHENKPSPRPTNKKSKTLIPHPSTTLP